MECLSPLRDSEWGNRLPAHGPESIFHGAAWARVLNETYGYSPFYFAVRGENHLTALLPVMEVDSWVTGRRGVSLPFTDQCEPLAPDSASFQQLFDHALTCASNRHWKYVELRGGNRFLTSAPASQRFYVHELDLMFDEKRLFANFRPPVRRAIRKAQKHGLTVQISQGLEGVRQFYSLLCTTRRKHGLPPQPFRFFENLHKHILAERGGMIALARTGPRTVAANFFIHHGQEAVFKFGASDPACQQLRGSDLVMWEGIRYYASKGFRTLHLGRTSLINEGLRRFKLGWGAREGSIDYFKYDLRKRAFVTGRDEAFGWYNRVFAALPVSLSRFLGSLLYRHVA